MVRLGMDLFKGACDELAVGRLSDERDGSEAELLRPKVRRFELDAKGRL